VAYQRNILPQAVLAAGLLLAGPRMAYANASTLTCNNPNSGTTWDIAVDFDRRVVDSFPADISDRWIVWQDTSEGRVYEFDRSSGDLRARFASSMGGSFLYYQCRERQ
jgi:hypothetical protein